MRGVAVVPPDSRHEGDHRVPREQPGVRLQPKKSKGLLIGARACDVILALLRSPSVLDLQ